MHPLGGSSTVCLRCQFRLLVAARPRTPRRISTAVATAAQGSDSVYENQPQHNDNTSNSTSSGVAPLTDAPAARLPPGALPSPRPPPSLAVFQSIVESQARVPSIPGLSGGGTASIELVKDMAKLQTMLEKEGATLAAAYAFFEKTIHPQIARDGASVPQIVKNQIATVLLHRLAHAKPRDFESNSLPSVSLITELMVELDVLRPAGWATLVIELIQHMFQLKTVPDAYNSIQEYETALARRDALLLDLLRAWEAFCSQSCPSEANSPVQRSEPVSPTADAKPAQLQTLQTAFGNMFPQYLVQNLLKPTFAAYATYRLLTDPAHRSPSVMKSAAPFIKIMTGLTRQSRPPHRGDFRVVFDAFPDLPHFLWPKKQEDVRNTAFPNTVTGPADQSTQRRAALHRQLGNAIKGRNPGLVRKAWLEFWGEEAVPNAARAAELAQCAELFNHFIQAYIMMRQPQQAVEVWRKMERVGLPATVKTWNAMLAGFGKARDARGLKTVWDRLLASGLQLDSAVWTARIHGLFLCDEPAAGLRALDEMAKIWNARLDPRNAAVAVQPSAEPVNAALTGLLRLNRDDDVPKVLAWAAKHDISPDIYTFNILLRPLVRRGDMKGVDDVFALMRSSGIRADEATFTVLLDGTLHNVGTLPPKQQVALVENILAAMKHAGVDINMRTYAKICYVLLHDAGTGDRTGDAVKAVLAHIWRRGLELTSHIYTMLAEHYFTRDPPDPDAVTALIENRRLHENRGVDRVFWERVVMGYCQVGDLPRALAAFDRVFVAGTTITLVTLYELLLRLVDAGDRQAALRVVDAASRIGSVGGDGGGGGGGGGGDGEGVGSQMLTEPSRFWRHRFWHLAYDQGLLSGQIAARFLEVNSTSRVDGER